MDAVVVWWRCDADGALTRLLTLEPAPTPLRGVWIGPVLTATPGGWAVASLPPLGRLSPALEARLAEAPGDPGDDWRAVMVGPGGDFGPAPGGTGLRDACLAVAVELLAERIAQPLVAEDPAHAGLIAARAGAGRLDIAPVAAGHPPTLGGQPVSGSWEQEPQTVTLLGGAGVLLPGATGDDAPVEVVSPSLRLPRAVLADLPDPPVLKLA